MIIFAMMLMLSPMLRATHDADYSAMPPRRARVFARLPLLILMRAAMMFSLPPRYYAMLLLPLR